MSGVSLRPGYDSPLDRLGRLPDLFHPFQTSRLQALTFCIKNRLDVIESAPEFRICTTKRLFRIGLHVPADIDDGEDEVAEFVADL